MQTMQKIEIDEEKLAEATMQAAGNWQKFPSFAWFNDTEDREQWTLVYTHNRDSGLLAQSNAAVIAKIMEPFIGGDCRAESHSHWACGWIDGYSIRVYRDGSVTEAFRLWYDVQQRLADYPVLNDEDYSQREYDATLVNIADAAWRLTHEYNLPEDWQDAVFTWLLDHDQGAVENKDDQGGYPSEESLRTAFEALGYEPCE